MVYFGPYSVPVQNHRDRPGSRFTVHYGSVFLIGYTPTRYGVDNDVAGETGIQAVALTDSLHVRNS